MQSNISQKRVCIIGAGPSGMSQMVAFSDAKAAGNEIPEIVCYEKQSAPGGLWNYTWRTGVDAHGEPEHCGMYRQLFSNGPKECVEFPNYTFQEHFGKAVGSYPPRESLLDYLLTRFKKYNCEEWVKPNTSVKRVTYNDMTSKFRVISQALNEEKELIEEFDYVVVATGHFSTPDMPDVLGLANFKGRVMHAHDLRNAEECRGQRVLVVGTSYSGEDSASMFWKNGAKSITCSWRTSQMKYEWPENVNTRPLLTSVEGDTVTFKDGTSQDFDTIVFCTGYQHYFPFMEESLRLRTPNNHYPKGLYKGIFWQKNPKLVYLGMQKGDYTFTMFDAQAWYARDAIFGKIPIPSSENRQADMDAWQDRWIKLQPDLSLNGTVVFHGDYIKELVQATDYPDWDQEPMNDVWLQWEKDKNDNIMTFRDKQHTSVHTGVKSAEPKVPWTKQFDFSNKAFVENTQNGIDVANHFEQKLTLVDPQVASLFQREPLWGKSLEVWRKLGSIDVSDFMQKGQFQKLDGMVVRKEGEYEGLFLPGEITGFGRRIFWFNFMPNGYIQEGQFTKGVRHGYGRCIVGSLHYVGFFKDNHYYGQGKLVQPDGSTEEGIWENDKLQK